MTRTLLTLTLVASAALAGCNKDSNNTADAANEAAANATANAAATVELPPSIASSKIYRCKDNSILYIDWLSDNKSANVRTEKNGTPTQVDTTAEGATLKGDANAPSITYNGQSCKA